MKYFVRLLATLPMLGAGMSVIVFWVLTVNSPLWILAVIVNICSFVVCAVYYEATVRYIASFIKRMAEDALR